MSLVPLMSLVLLMSAPVSAIAAENGDAALVVAQADPAAAGEDDDAYDTKATPAGEEEDPWANVEELIVTGSGVAQSLLSTPTSVTRFDAAELEAGGVQTIGDISAATPNLEIRQSSATQAQFFIRGIGLADFGANATSAVAVFQDGIAFGTAPLQLGQIFDTQGVDVLKGPQGTLAFRNASAGAISITSRKPEFEPGAEIRMRYGTWAPSTNGAHQGLIQDYEGALNIPVIDDVLAARISFRAKEADGYKVNGCGRALPFAERGIREGRAIGQIDPSGIDICGEREPTTWPLQNDFLGTTGISPIPVGLDNRFGEESNWAARGILLLTPPDTEMEFLLNIHGARLDQQPVVGQAAGTGFYRNLNSASRLGGLINGQSNFNTNYVEPDQRKEFLTLCQETPPTNACANPQAANTLARGIARNLDDKPYRGDWNREGRTRLESWGIGLTATIPILDSGFTTVQLNSITGFDTYKRYQNRDLDNTPETIFEGIDNDRVKQVWQELSFTGTLDALPLDWDIGAYYYYEELEANLFLQLPESPIVGAPKNFNNREYDQDTKSFGVWGQAKWEILENFSLDFGFRYNEEDKTFDLVRTGPDNRPERTKQDDTWTEWTGTISLQHFFTEDISATLKYTRGFKAGTFNASVSVQSQTEPIKPEIIDSFEGIFATSFWEGRIGLSAEFFFYLYKDYQVFLFDDPPQSPPVLEIQNAKEVQSYGMDADLSLSPLEGLVDSRIERLKFSLRFGWLEAQFNDFSDVRLFQNNLGAVIQSTQDFSGNQLPNAPQFKVSGVLEWPFDVDGLGTITPRYDFTFTDDVFFDAEEGRGNIRANGQNVLPRHTIGQRSYILHNFRLTWDPPGGRLQISGWIRNMLDKRYKTFAFDASQFSQLVLMNVSAPRTIGGDIKFIF